MKICAFLSRYGTPRTISILFDFNVLQKRQMAYQCSLCGLCTAVCAEGVDPCALFLEIRRYHVESGSFDFRPYRFLIRLLTASPSCTKIFREYGQGLSVQTVYEVFQRQGNVAIGSAGRKGEISVHDPCQLRDYPELQSAVRSLLVDPGYTVVEMRHREKTTFCCGEGGAVACIESSFSTGWTEIQRQESIDCRLVTYCAGCAGFLGRVMPTFHILDLLFRVHGASDSEIAVSRGMMTYVNRLLLKLRLASMRL